MRNRRGKRFRYRSNGRGYQHNINGGDKVLGTILSQDNRHRNNFKNNQSASKLYEKYNALAKEALSSGDKILSENYFQHADHFARIIEQRNLNQNKIQVSDSTNTNDKKTEEETSNNQNTTLDKK
tara:strand:+ start:478 stop:852 length:375 start_codon:yes stop_codon:yes gene_type:complete